VAPAVKPALEILTSPVPVAAKVDEAPIGAVLLYVPAATRIEVADLDSPALGVNLTEEVGQSEVAIVHQALALVSVEASVTGVTLI
jgi:hypothetical protein